MALKPNNDVMSVWIRSGKDQTKIAQVKEDIERALMLDESIMKLEYEDF